MCQKLKESVAFHLLVQGAVAWCICASFVYR
jgi:hypothetical protein